MSVESKQIVGLYAHKVPDGIKIGYAKHYESRLKQHKTTAFKSHLIRQCPATKQIDNDLKKILNPMFPENKTGSETYNITEKQLHEIFDTIEECKYVNEKKIQEIIFPDEEEPGGNTTIIYTDNLKLKSEEAIKQPAKVKSKHIIKTVLQKTINKPKIFQSKKVTSQLAMHPTMTPTPIQHQIVSKNNTEKKIITNKINKTIDANKFPIYNNILSVWPDNHGNNARFNITAELFQKMWGRRINKYEKNRVIDDDRVTRLSQYIADNYNKPSYILPELICTQKENSYILLDGQHRASAIFKLMEYDDHLDLCVPINVSGIDLTDNEMYEKFISINKSVPIADCCLSSTEIDKLYKEVLKKLQNTFGKDIFTHASKINQKMDIHIIENLIENKKLTILSKTLPMFIPTAPQICKVLIDLNDSLVDRCRKMGLICEEQVIHENGVKEFVTYMNGIRMGGKIQKTTYQTHIEKAQANAQEKGNPIFLLNLLSAKSDVVSMIIDAEIAGSNKNNEESKSESGEECKSEGLSDIDDNENDVDDMNIDD